MTSCVEKPMCHVPVGNPHFSRLQSFTRNTPAEGISHSTGKNKALSTCKGLTLTYCHTNGPEIGSHFLTSVIMFPRRLLVDNDSEYTPTL